MNEQISERIILYTSRWCGQSIGVQRFLTSHEVPVDQISIDGDKVARQELIEINDGYASVPTLVFPDGTKLTEPSIPELRKKLGLEDQASLADRVRKLLHRTREDDDQ